MKGLEIGEVTIASPEDVIISKLIWRRESQSDKQWRDILGVLLRGRQASQKEDWIREIALIPLR